MKIVFSIAPLSLPVVQKDFAGKTEHAIFQGSREGGPGIRSQRIGLPDGGQKDVDGNRVDHKSGVRGRKPRCIKTDRRLSADGPGYAPLPARRIFADPQILWESPR